MDMRERMVEEGGRHWQNREGVKTRNMLWECNIVGNDMGNGKGGREYDI